MSMQVTLERDGHDQPWGFRLQGGVDVGLPLSVLRVLVGTPAESVLKKGDVVTKISQTGTSGLSHQQAVDLFNKAGNQLEITIKRSGSGSAVSVPSQPNVSALQATAAIRQQQQQQLAAQPLDPSQSPQVAALPRTTFVLKSDLPATAAPAAASSDEFSIQNQPYRTTPLVQPSARSINELGVGVGSYSHLRLQEDICTGVREPCLVPISPAQAQQLKANEFLMKQKVSNPRSKRAGTPESTEALGSVMKQRMGSKRAGTPDRSDPLAAIVAQQVEEKGPQRAHSPARSGLVSSSPAGSRRSSLERSIHPSKSDLKSIEFVPKPKRVGEPEPVRTKRDRTPDPSVSIRSLLRPTPLLRGRPAWKTSPIQNMGRFTFRIGNQTISLKPAKNRIIPGQPMRTAGGAFKPKPLISPMMWKNMLKSTPMKKKAVKKLVKEKRAALPEVKLRKEMIILIAVRDTLEEVCTEKMKEGLPGKKFKPQKKDYREHEGVKGPAKWNELVIKFLPGKRSVQVTITLHRYEEYEDDITVGKPYLPPGPSTSFTFSMDYLKTGDEEPEEAFVMPEKVYDSIDVENTVHIQGPPK